MKIKTTAPGKLVIAGEWSVLKPGNTAIIAAIDQRMTVTIQTLTDSQPQTVNFNLANLGLQIKATIQGTKLVFAELKTVEQEKIKFLKSCLELILELTAIPCSLQIEADSSTATISTPQGEQKVGFGSSAAISVAMIKALVKLTKLDLGIEQREMIFKLSALAHYRAQNKAGSSFDIAAATYATTISYSRFDPIWLESTLKTHSLKEIITRPWKGLIISPLSIPSGFKILIGFTGYSASTTALVQDMETHPAQEAISLLFQKININTLSLIQAIKDANTQLFYDHINHNQTLLIELDNLTGLGIITKELGILAKAAKEAGAAGKLSGAGGGDSGIAFYDVESQKEAILAAWQIAGITEIKAQLIN